MNPLKINNPSGPDFYRHRSKVDYVVRGSKIYRMSDGGVAAQSARPKILKQLAKNLEKPFTVAGVGHKLKVGWLYPEGSGYKLFTEQQEAFNVSTQQKEK